VIPADAIAVVQRKTVVKIVETFTICKKSANPVVTSRLSIVVRSLSKSMRERIDAKRGMKDDNYSQADRHDESSQRMPDPPGNEHGENKSSAD